MSSLLDTVVDTLRNTIMTLIAAIGGRRHGGTGGTSGGTGGGGSTYVPVLTTMTLSGDPSVVATHQTSSYTDIAPFDQKGLPFVGAPGPYTYQSSNPSVATISAQGIATGLSAGTTTITAKATNSLGSVVTSTGVTLTVAAQVATTVTVSPSSTTLVVPATQQFTAVVQDQAALPNVMSGATGTWDTADHSKATVSAGGLVTSVAATSSPIAVTFTSGSAVGSAAVTVTATPTSPVTAVSLLYNSAPATQLLLRTGSTYQLFAQDQANTPLTSVGVFSTSDATNFPIDATTGVITPGTGAKSLAATFTYTHTASQHTASVSATCLGASTPLLSDKASNYANDAAWRANIGSNVTTTSNGSTAGATPAPTGGLTALFNDGINEGQITLDSTRPFMGAKTFLMSFPVGNSSPLLRTGPNQLPSAGLTRLWLRTVKRYDPGFTLLGTGTAGASYKDAPWVSWNGPVGRTGIEFGNATQGVSGETGSIDMFNGVGSLTSPTNPSGGADATIVGAFGPTTFSSGLWDVDVTLYEVRSGNIMSARYWRTTIGSAVGAWKAQSGNGLIEGPMLVGSPPSGRIISPFGENYNRGIPYQMYKSLADWEVVDGTVYGDPFGLAGAQGTPTLTGISGGSVLQGDTTKTVTLTGTNLTDWCWPVFSNAGVKAQSITRTGSTTFTVVVNVDSTASSSVGTVAIYNGATQVTSGTQTFTVGTLTPPNAPTANNATSVQNNTLTFPVTLSASGGLPSALAWRYSTDNVSFTNGTDLTLTSPSLGQVVSQPVSVPTASTLYYVQFASKNNGGTSSYTASVTGTTGSAASLIATNVIRDINFDVGTDVSTDGAGIGSVTDQSATAGVFQQGTASKKPILKKTLYNGHNAARFTSTNSCNLTPAGVVSAYNPASMTEYVVAKSLVDTPGTLGALVGNIGYNGGTAIQGTALVIQAGASGQVQSYAGQGTGTPLVVTNTNSATVASGLHVFTTVYDADTGTITTYTDGIAGGTATGTYAAQSLSPVPCSLGSIQGSSNFVDADIARDLVYSVAHTSANVAQNVSALKTLYGIA